MPRRCQFLLLVVPLLFGCSAIPNPAVPPPDVTAELQRGYDDGCLSGYDFAGRDGFQTAFRRDAARYAAGGDYHEAWDRAYQACFEDQRRAPRILPGAR
jgi:hypothetical protein